MPFDDRDPSALDWRETLALERRRATEQAMWTIPGASLAAQAFLYTRGLDPSTTVEARALVAFVGLVTAVATIQILIEQGFRMQVFRLYVHARRRQRGADHLGRDALIEEIQAAGSPEAERLARYTNRALFRPAVEMTNAARTWLSVMVVLAAVDIGIFLIAFADLVGLTNWDPFAAPAA
jgi:hypothetical protein